MIRYASHTCYKSPTHKLVRFFEQSRNNWREKHKGSKTVIKRLENKVRFLTHTKETWKQEALELRKEVKALRQQVQQKVDEKLNDKKKSQRDNA